MRKSIVFLLCLFLFCSSISCVSMAQEEAKAVLFVSKPDTDGYITLKLTVYNASFQGIHADISYLPSSVSITDEAILEMIVGEHVQIQGKVNPGMNILTEVVKAHHPSESSLTLAAVVNLAQKYPNEKVNEHLQIVADHEGVCIFELKVKKTGEKSPGFQFAQNMNVANPQGLTVALGGKALDVYTEVVYEQTGEVVSRQISGKTAAEQQPKSEEQIRRERIENTVILQVQNYAATVGGALRRIDAQNKSVVPYLENGRTMVPLRFIAEAYGASVLWEEESREIQINSDDRTVRMKIADARFEINGEVKISDAVPVLVESRTFVPLRIITEALGKHVQWVENAACVVISPASQPWDMAGEVEARLLNDALFIMSPLVRDMI